MFFHAINQFGCFESYFGGSQFYKIGHENSTFHEFSITFPPLGSQGKNFKHFGLQSSNMGQNVHLTFKHPVCLSYTVQK